MIYTPQDSAIAKHIDYYWIVDDATALLGDAQRIYAYPGITPEMIIVLDGYRALIDFDHCQNITI